MNLPNLITLGRLLSVPVIIWLIVTGAWAWAFWVLAAAGVSDAVDGFIAKRFDQRSELGALLDPIADKALLVSIYVALGVSGSLPNWLVILVVFRDLLIVGGFLFATALSQRIPWQPLLVSKINTAFQIGLVTVVLAGYALGLDAPGVISIFIYLVGTTTVISGAAYLVRWARAFAGATVRS